jgi:hypothetical protein
VACTTERMATSRRSCSVAKTTVLVLVAGEVDFDWNACTESQLSKSPCLPPGERQLDAGTLKSCERKGDYEQQSAEHEHDLIPAQ